jgi:uncharacterized membrane protein
VFFVKMQQQNYTLNKIKQIIDISNDATNFRVYLRVFSTSPTDVFQAIIIDQETLDSDNNIQFKEVTHEMSAELVWDKNIKKTYYLVLRSNESVNVTLEIRYERLPDFIEQGVAVDNSVVMGRENYSAGEIINNNYLLYGLILILLALVFYWGYVKYHEKVDTHKASASTQLRDFPKTMPGPIEPPKSMYIPTLPPTTNTNTTTK